MKLKKENPESIWRCKVLQLCMDKEISEETLLLITGAIKESNNKEGLAKLIFKVLTEEQDELVIRERVKLLKPNIIGNIAKLK